VKRRLIVTLSCCLSCLSVSGCERKEAGSSSRFPTSGGVLAIGELTWEEIDALDRERTLFLLTVGMLEEHGPTCPSAPTPSASSTKQKGSRIACARRCPDGMSLRTASDGYSS
jgi:hypothetical protein